MPKASVNYALAATLLAQGMDLEQIAPQVGAKTPNSLRVGLNRKGVNVTAAKVLQNIAGRTCSVTLRIASQASEILRRDASDILQAHVSKLKEVPAKANLAHIERVGQALEPLIRSAKIVHDWGNQEAQGVVMAGLLDDATPVTDTQEPIQIESSTLPVVDSTQPNPSSQDNPS